MLTLSRMRGQCPSGTIVFGPRRNRKLILRVAIDFSLHSSRVKLCHVWCGRVTNLAEQRSRLGLGKQLFVDLDEGLFIVNEEVQQMEFVFGGEVCGDCGVLRLSEFQERFFELF